MPPYWAKVGTQEQWTVIGEVHASDGISTQFSYGVSQSMSLQIGASANGGGWSISGSITIQNTFTNTLASPWISAAAYQVQSHYVYEEDSYMVCSSLNGGGYQPAGQYKVYPTSQVYDAQFGSSIGGDYASPCDVLNGVYGTYGNPQAGWSKSVSESAGFTYSVGATLTGLIGGSTTSLSIGVTTQYTVSTTTTVSINYQIGNQYPNVYYYYRSGSSYLALYWTTPGVGCPGTDSAQFVSQNLPPSTMCTSQIANVGVTMKNTGSSTWGYDGPTPWRLGSQNPQDNTANWGMNRIYLPQTVSPGNQYSFTWQITAPSTSSSPNFQWRMVHDGVQWFGDYSPNLSVNVIMCTVSLTSTTATLPADGMTVSTITAQLPDNRQNILVSFSTTLGTLSSSSCNTGTSGSCSITIKSTTAGAATINASAPGFNTGQTTVKFYDFNAIPSVSSLTIYQGTSGQATITWNSLNGFSGTITLVPNVTPSGPSLFLSASTVSASPTTPGSVTLTVSTTASTSPGTYTVTVTGTSNTLSHYATITVIIPDFTVNSTPTSLTILQGSSGTSTIQLSSLGGFTGTVTLTVAPVSGLTFNLNPSSVTLSGSTATSTLTIYTTSTTPTGPYTVIVTGTGGPSSIKHITQIALTVTISLYSLHDDFTYSSVSNMVSAGWTICGTAQGQVTVGSSILGLTNDGTNVGQACWSNIPSGVTSWTVTVRGQYASQLAGYTSGCCGATWAYAITASHTYGFDLDGYYHNYYLFRDGVKVSTVSGYVVQMGAWHDVTIDMRNGVITAIADGNIITTYSEAAGTNNALTTVMMNPGWGTVTNYDFVTMSQVNPAQPADFAMGSSPISVTAKTGTNAVATINLSSLAGFTGTVNLTSSTSPSSGLTCTLTPTSLALSTSATSTLSCNGTPGTYTVTVTATSGNISHTTTVIITITS
jgi:hypothetical protein